MGPLRLVQAKPFYCKIRFVIKRSNFCFRLDLKQLTIPFLKLDHSMSLFSSFSSFQYSLNIVDSEFEPWISGGGSALSTVPQPLPLTIYPIRSKILSKIPSLWLEVFKSKMKEIVGCAFAVGSSSSSSSYL